MSQEFRQGTAWTDYFCSLMSEISAIRLESWKLEAADSKFIHVWGLRLVVSLGPRFLFTWASSPRLICAPSQHGRWLPQNQCPIPSSWKKNIEAISFSEPSLENHKASPLLSSSGWSSHNLHPEPQNKTLFGNGIITDVLVRMRSYRSGLGLKSNTTGVLLRRQSGEDRDTQGTWLVKTEVEIGVVPLQVK